MSDRNLLAIILVLSIASCTACTVSENYKDASLTPQQMCVQKALFHTDRLKCLEQK